eukprot:TRINITY_DN28975_c0_g2_i1.p1 TRINITY_DN28975_c0_g2~~TRINITY_DN28975_c0_g2_i1.p1  ORF type:complete len:717 (-),score=185.43 TRINITY_DN28975_c0_g2_i1:181-2331(-)
MLSDNLLAENERRPSASPSTAPAGESRQPSDAPDEPSKKGFEAVAAGGAAAPKELVPRATKRKCLLSFVLTSVIVAIITALIVHYAKPAATSSSSASTVVTVPTPSPAPVDGGGGVGTGNNNSVVATVSPTDAPTDAQTSAPTPFTVMSHSLVLTCEIFCTGEILQTIQLSTLFSDTKNFVDMPLKFDPAQVWQNWTALKQNASNYVLDSNNDSVLSVDALAQFVADNFNEVGSDVIQVTPTDWTENPAFLNNINDSALQSYAKQVNEAWKFLGRAPSDDVYNFPTRHTLIALKNQFMIVPGGRFLEEYYWDTYFVNKGLIASGMVHSARLITENLLDFVSKLGFVPNGARKYYENRSQPPMLTLMVKDIVDAYMNSSYLGTNVEAKFALSWLEENFPTLLQEYSFWMTLGEHAVMVNDKYTLNRYYANYSAAGPRPEEYREDFNQAANLTSDADKKQVYTNIIAAAETGWDFSSRWFSDRINKNHADTTNVIPVDLNTIMCKVEEAMLEFSQLLGDTANAQKFSKALQSRKEAISEILWNPANLQWVDHYLVPKENETEPLIGAASNFYPLWGNCFNVSELKDTNGNTGNITPAYLMQSLIDSNLILPGGIATTLNPTGQQWDYPNAWAPIQYILIDGLSNIGFDDLAFALANRWIVTTYLAFNSTGYMHEKYDALVLGMAGDGGEYPPQIGFGWTNGVTLDLLNRYGARAHYPL